jgi:cysteine desulfurase
MIYLDHNATTPVDPEVLEAMLPFLTEHFGNPSSAHPSGQAARAGIDQARAHVAALLGAKPTEILFTSGGTEANNLAIRGVAAARPQRRHLITSVVEHPAVSEPMAALVAAGWSLDTIGVDGHGQVDAEAVLKTVSDQTSLISLMHANNEVGTLQPVAQVAAGAGDCLVHTDAAQSVGKVDVNVDALGVDLLTLAGHKLHAPKGIGALYVRTGTPLEPFVRGAGHERGLRPGTENVASIAGLGEAARLARLRLTETTVKLRRLTDRMWTQLSDEIPGLVLQGHPTERLPNTLNLRFPNARGSALLARAKIVAASTGSACHDHGETPSKVLLAMGVPAQASLGSIRLSLGHCTTEDEVDRVARALADAWRQRR